MRNDWTKFAATSGHYASVSGGAESVASGSNASVSGGKSNEAGSLESTVSGGEQNIATIDQNDWFDGSWREDF